MSADFSRQFGLLANYNRWANRALFDACARLSDAEVDAKRPAFFSSILGTLNHLLVGDRTWLARLRNAPNPGYSLDQMLCGTLSDLDQARSDEDGKIIAFVESLDAAGFDATIKYRNIAGAEFENTVSDVLTHMFNHQAHHRGQVHDMLSQTDVPPPELDLIFYLRQGD
jgi:uncharacterized damage-inducible protein DinB